jgi:hypothetical protein
MMRKRGYDILINNGTSDLRMQNQNFLCVLLQSYKNGCFSSIAMFMRSSGFLRRSFSMKLWAFWDMSGGKFIFFCYT